MMSHGTTAEERGSLRLAPDASRARLGDGREVGFTALEAAALTYLAANPGRTLTRQNFLDSLGDAEGRRTDRSIDFLINRLRRKLGDRPNPPKFIATRYGVGYVWIASVTTDVEVSGAFCVVHTGGGLRPDKPHSAAGRRFAEALKTAIEEQLGEGKTVLLLSDLDGADRATDGPAIAVEVAVLTDGGGVDALITARLGIGGPIVHAARHPLAGSAQVDGPDAQVIAETILLRDWTARMTRAAENVPLPMAPHTASDRPFESGEVWPVTDTRLRALRQAHPDDPAIKLHYAGHLHAKYVVLGPHLFEEGLTDCAADEAEIERLVFEALDYALDRPDSAISAAKLMHFVSSRYGDMAMEIAESALKTSQRPAISLAMVGQLRAFNGRLEPAISLLEEAVEMSPAESEFRSYVLIMLSQALMAAGDREGLSRARTELFGIIPSATPVLAPFFADPLVPSPGARAATLAMPKKRAHALMRYMFYICARLFRDPAHGAAFLRAPAALFQDRFGPDVMPAEVRARFPALVL